MESENKEETTQEPSRIISFKKKFDWKLLVTTLVTILVLVSLISIIMIENTNKSFRRRCQSAHEVYNTFNFTDVGNYGRFAVAVDSRECSRIGRQIFERGGSAVDVAIASGICNSVMNPQSMGLGGGHFMTFYSKGKNKAFMIDAREAAPINSYREMFVRDHWKSTNGGLATGIPGELKGYVEAYKLGGKLPWKDLFTPTINLCRNGFHVSNALADALKSKQYDIKQNEGLRDIFINPKTKQVYRADDIIKMPKLALTLSIISENSNGQSFYNGILTDIMVDEINENGGNVTREDFVRYKAKVHDNRLMIKLNDRLRVYTPPMPSSGILVSFILRIMMGYSLTDENAMSNQTRATFYHRLIESFKHAYSKRTEMGDEEFLEKSKLERLYQDLQSQNFINSIRNKISDTTTHPSHYYGDTTQTWDTGTAHISVLAENGDAVSLTSSVNNYFGAKYAGKNTGIIYNDIMDDFSTPGLTNSFGFAATEANSIQPGKRPMSSMSPIVIVNNDNNVVLVLGASGGSKIISSVSQVALKAAIMNANIKDAIDARRVHHQLSPDFAQIEAEFSEEIQDELRRVGHHTMCYNYGGSVNQGIQRRGNRILAYCDPRKGGEPDGI